MINVAHFNRKPNSSHCHTDATHNCQTFTIRVYTYVHVFFQRIFVKIVLPIILTYVLAAQKNRLNETVLLSIQNLCSGGEIRIL